MHAHLLSKGLATAAEALAVEAGFAGAVTKMTSDAPMRQQLRFLCPFFLLGDSKTKRTPMMMSWAFFSAVADREESRRERSEVSGRAALLLAHAGALFPG